MSARLSGPPDHTPRRTPSATELRQCRAHGTAAAALDRDGLTQGWCGATQSYRDAELAQRKGAAKHLPPDPQAAASGGLAVLPRRVSTGDSSWKWPTVSPLATRAKVRAACTPYAAMSLLNAVSGG
jgi:hypothetical protein